MKSKLTLWMAGLMFSCSAAFVAQAEEAMPTISHDDIAVLEWVDPVYPMAAVKNGVQGYVLLSYDLNAKGKPVNVKVIEEFPRRTFGVSAKRALLASKFSATDKSDETVEVQGLVRKYVYELEAVRVAGRVTIE
ncbi:energy transducer TonB [Sessilibacter corallicola]|uniref:TonB C-terminal domain-containing protein n=1 Tax=Sessilibacter corallicola TaxID=2904075 RepID=A0ABQ0AAX6_9GAMM|nr:energy transducer TonB [Sessilibacter corallicola]MCE2028199.1 energy transducer TonB [Sessilibacter corallicola]